jgi:hypothetical protein
MEVLHLLPPYTVADVASAYKERAKRLHPDAGGDPEDFKSLRAAYEQALSHARFQESRRAWLGDRIELYHQRQELIARIESSGGACTLQPADSYLYEYGEDFAEILRRLSVVRLTGPTVTDSALAWLRMQNPALSEVRLLDVGGTGISDESLHAVAALTGLRCADLRKTGVTAEGLERLLRLPELEWVHVGGTRVGALARRRLRRQFPRVAFATGSADTPPPADGPAYEHLRLQRRMEELGLLP